MQVASVLFNSMFAAISSFFTMFVIDVSPLMLIDAMFDIGLLLGRVVPVATCPCWPSSVLDDDYFIFPLPMFGEPLLWLPVCFYTYLTVNGLSEF